ncbi:MAG: hypothetical protein H6750_20545 [Nitrospiraceae bacterium]|nr:hypothetical protein [Nitrospiraceae bacterium]
MNLKILRAQRFEKTAQTDQDGRFCFDVPAVVTIMFFHADAASDSTKGKRVGMLVYAYDW